MSYIYEALLKAERERQSGSPSLEDQNIAAAATIAPAANEEVPVLPPEKIHVSTEAIATEAIASEAIAQHNWSPFVPAFPTLAKHGRGLEQFRSLRSHIYQARNETPLKTILVSSGMPTEGKSFITANLALSLARNSSNQILLIDGDLRRPSLNHMLGAPNEIGLADYLAGTAELHAVMQRGSVSDSNDSISAPNLANLTFIPTGTPHENASELITNKRFKELISRVSASFDWILIDSPPVLVFADAVDLADAVDAVLLVVRGAQTTYEVAQRAKTSFANSRILGVVLNDVKNPPRRESYYNYYYYGKQDPAAASEPATKQEMK